MASSRTWRSIVPRGDQEVAELGGARRLGRDQLADVEADHRPLRTAVEQQGAGAPSEVDELHDVGDGDVLQAAGNTHESDQPQALHSPLASGLIHRAPASPDSPGCAASGPWWRRYTPWTTAVNRYGAYPGSWAIIPNSGWIDSPVDFGTGNFFFRPTAEIVIPAGAQNATISGQFLSDNEGWVYLNGGLIASQGNIGFTSPVSFSGNLNVGANAFYFEIQNDGGPGGLDYVATITYDI